jgi:hypothetical protein
VEEFALTRSVDLREVSYVFPLAAIPQWIAGRIFYQFLDQVLRWLLVPLIGAYAAYEALAAVVQPVGRSLALRPLFLELAYVVGLLVVAFTVLFLISRRAAAHAVSAMPSRYPGQTPGREPYREDVAIRRLLEEDRPPPGHCPSRWRRPWRSRPHMSGPTARPARPCGRRRPLRRRRRPRTPAGWCSRRRRRWRRSRGGPWRRWSGRLAVRAPAGRRWCGRTATHGPGRAAGPTVGPDGQRCPIGGLDVQPACSNVGGGPVAHGFLLGVSASSTLVELVGAAASTMPAVAAISPGRAGTRGRGRRRPREPGRSRCAAGPP